MIRRRDFITLLGGAAVSWPLKARAQQPAMPVIGYVSALSPQPNLYLLEIMRRSLAEAGFVEGRTIAIEYRWAEGHYERLPALASELANRNVALIVASPTPPALAAKAATASVPIVFGVTDDPVKLGLVSSIATPGRQCNWRVFFPV